jgi:hypothetical protein
MLSLDQIQRELKAIQNFDILFSAATEHYSDEEIGFEMRKVRRLELLGLAELLASKN